VDNVSEHVNTISLLLRASAKYIDRRIMYKHQKDAYRLAITECLYHIEYGWKSIDVIRQKIQGVRDDVDHYYKVGWFNKNASNRTYYLMACDLADQVIDSIETRFIVGSRDPELKSYRNNKVYLDEDDSIFWSI